MAVRVQNNPDLPKLEEITIGADPELFLVTPNGKFISAIGLIGGTKAMPRGIEKGCAVQEDNVAVEFNIPPATSVDEFIGSINHALEYLTNHVVEKGLLLSVTASKVFDKDQLEHPKAKAFGCTPDMNVWTKQQNDPPKPDKELRTCGGHIHFGGLKRLDRWQLGRWCDMTLALPSVLEDEDTQRRSMYGKAGCIRIKPYGIEYRTLSNYWLRDENTMRTVYNRALDAVDRTLTGWLLTDEEGKDIQEAINNSDKKAAEQLMARYNIE